MFAVPKRREIRRIAETSETMLTAARELKERYNAARIVPRCVAYCPTTGRFRMFRSTGSARRNEIVFIAAADWKAFVSWVDCVSQVRKERRRFVARQFGRYLYRRLIKTLRDSEFDFATPKTFGWRGVEKIANELNAKNLGFKDGRIVKKEEKRTMEKTSESSVAERDEAESYLAGMLESAEEVDSFRSLWKALGALDGATGLSRRQQTLIALTEKVPLKNLLSRQSEGIDHIATGRWAISSFKITDESPEEYAELGRALFVGDAFFVEDAERFDEYVDYERYGRDRVRDCDKGFVSKRYKTWVDCPGNWFFKTESGLTSN